MNLDRFTRTPIVPIYARIESNKPFNLDVFWSGYSLFKVYQLKV